MLSKLTCCVVTPLILLSLALIHYCNITHFGGELIKADTLSTIYDASAAALLKGSVEIPSQDIQWEAFKPTDKIVTYFGIFPAFFRVVLNELWPEYRGMWGKLCSLTALCLSLIFVFLSIRLQLSKNTFLSARTKSVLGIIFLIGIGLSSPLFFLTTNGSIYHEAIIWALTFSLAAIYCLLLIKDKPRQAYLGFSVASALCLLTRVTFALPLLLIALILLILIFKSSTWPRNERLSVFACLIGPIILSVFFTSWINFQRFGSPLIFADYTTRYDKEPITFELDRIPDIFQSYFWPKSDNFFIEFPNIRFHRSIIAQSKGVYHVEGTLALALTAPWLLLVCFWGYCYLPKADPVIVLAAAYFLIQAALVLTFFSVTNRYNTEFFPFLVFGAYLFLGQFRLNRTALRRCLVALLALLVCSGSIVNIAATLDWSINSPIFVSDLERSRTAEVMKYLRFIVHHFV